MRRKRNLVWVSDDSMNLTPLLDVIFNLIFFFILATTIREAKSFLEVQLPSSSEAAQREAETATLIITVTDENKIYLGEQQITAKNLEAELKEKHATDVKEIIIRGDAKAYNQTIVDVLDACARAGHYAVSIEVKSREAIEKGSSPAPP
jgi:biopolymer transport protein ExbD